MIVEQIMVTFFFVTSMILGFYCIYLMNDIYNKNIYIEELESHVKEMENQIRQI